MKYCPNCRAEYHDDVEICHGCQVALVDRPPQDPVHPWESIEPVVIHTAAAVIDADLIVGLLNANGVRAFAAGTGAEVWTGAGQIGQMTRIPGPLNAIRIMVHPDDVDDARAILDQPAASVVAGDYDFPRRWALDPVIRHRILWIVAVVLLLLTLTGVFGEA